MTVKDFTPFIIYTVLVSIILLLFRPAIHWYSIVSLLAGYGFWNLAEYAFHRFAFHNYKMSRKMKRLIAHGHKVHHRNPDKDNELFLPFTLTFPFSLLLAGVYYLITFTGGEMVIFYIGLVAGYFFYEFMHYAAHHLELRPAFFRRMKLYHNQHHYKTPNAKFMVSNPVFDRLFRTQ
jgi:dihydroceramide fatty acyl 2-hydroxylase